MASVHVDGSNNPLGIPGYVDKIPFTPYFYVKDAFGLLVFFTFFASIVILSPNTLGHADNYIPANPMVTPPHIVPEWYFLPFYAILRSIPDKLGGVLGMGGAIVLLALLPFLNTAEVRSSAFRPLHRKLFWMFVADVVLLGWIGGSPAEEPYIFVGQLATVFYFGYIVLFVPALGILERLLVRLGSVEVASSEELGELSRS
jgi:quinol-cytochrome oxidoreductase complex cytochrome b subunit